MPMKPYKLLLNDAFILGIILLNAVVIFISGFGIAEKPLDIVEALFTLIFVFEIGLKIRTYGAPGYFAEHWNKFDFIVVLLSLPSLAIPFGGGQFLGTNIFMTLRIFRVFKSFRMIKYLPNANSFVVSVQRALQTSYIIFIGFFVLIFITALISGAFFREVAPQYFGNPMRSLYTIFQLFSVEGWYEIPNAIAQESSPTAAFFAKLYFSGLLMVGGIMGLSLVNSIFVDAMVSDNNDDLEAEIKKLTQQVHSLEQKLDQFIQTNGRDA